MKEKRLFLSLLVLVVLSMLLASCNGAGETTTTTAATTTGATTTTSAKTTTTTGAATTTSKTTTGTTTTKPAAGTTVTVTVTPAATDKTYKAVNPVGEFIPVQTRAISPRLDTLDGKTIYVIQGEADPVVMPGLYEKLTKDYPKTTWVFYNPVSSFGASTIEAEPKAKAQGIIRGNGW